jgi:N6-adenosine-specific RNA methylase IME4
LNPPYSTIVADPPWTPTIGAGREHYDKRQHKARPQAQYSTLNEGEIAALPVGDLAGPQAHLYLWCLAQHVDWGFAVARSWGFEPAITFTWCKPGLGVGRFRCNTEHFILARRGGRSGNPFGRGGRDQQATDGTWFEWPRAHHSAKPAAFFDLVEQVSPGPYVELFARAPRLGWDSWGKGYEGAA